MEEVYERINKSVAFNTKYYCEEMDNLVVTRNYGRRFEEYKDEGTPINFVTEEKFAKIAKILSENKGVLVFIYTIGGTSADVIIIKNQNNKKYNLNKSVYELTRFAHRQRRLNGTENLKWVIMDAEIDE